MICVLLLHLSPAWAYLPHKVRCACGICTGKCNSNVLPVIVLSVILVYRHLSKQIHILQRMERGRMDILPQAGRRYPCKLDVLVGETRQFFL